MIRNTTYEGDNPIFVLNRLRIISSQLCNESVRWGWMEWWRSLSWGKEKQWPYFLERLQLPGWRRGMFPQSRAGAERGCSLSASGAAAGFTAGDRVGAERRVSQVNVSLSWATLYVYVRRWFRGFILSVCVCACVFMSRHMWRLSRRAAAAAAVREQTTYRRVEPNQLPPAWIEASGRKNKNKKQYRDTFPDRVLEGEANRRTAVSLCVLFCFYLFFVYLKYAASVCGRAPDSWRLKIADGASQVSLSPAKHRTDCQRRRDQTPLSYAVFNVTQI